MIDIIVINYNCVDLLQECIEALLNRQDDPVSRRVEYVITVVDNNSSDGSAAMVASRFPQVRVIAREENDGYSAAVNDGIASTRNSEILLINSDVIITPATVSALARIWERLDFPGILGPIHFEEDGFPQQTWGVYPTRQAEALRKQVEQAAAKRLPWARKALMQDASRTREVDWVSGSCMFFSRPTANDVGPWDQNFFLYFEDIDWCLRAKAMGYKIYHTPEAQIMHLHGASTGSDPDFAEVEYRHSQLYFTQKHLGAWALFQLRCYLTVKSLGRWFAGRRSGFERRTSLQVLKEAWRNPTA